MAMVVELEPGHHEVIILLVRRETRKTRNLIDYGFEHATHMWLRLGVFGGGTRRSEACIVTLTFSNINSANW